MCGITIPQNSYRRIPNPMAKSNGKYYLLATDELEYFLHTTYGEPETISRDLNTTRSVAQITSYIQGVRGS